MADNFLSNNSETIYVEQEYNNIIIVDPNKTIDSNGNIQERLVDHENLVTFANLEAELLPRTKLAVGGSPQDRVNTISIAKINFLAPNKEDYFTNGYYEEFSGLNTVDGMGNNQLKETVIEGVKNSKPYTKSTITSNGVDGSVNNGLLGIRSINITLGTSFIPTVNITLVDVQGRALFQLGDQSPYAAFFNLPYPPFYLTIKGYYGKAVKYQLNLEKFNAKFLADGNYEVSLVFRGYKFNILNEIEIGSLLAVPHMFSSSYEYTNRTNQTQSNNIVESIITERGYEKIVQVYSEYKSKGLIPENFPEMTLAQFMNKIDTFETDILSKYPKANVQPLTDCKNYKTILSKYYGEVYSQDLNSWFSKWLNPKPLIGKNEEEYFLFKDFTPSQKDLGKKELAEIINRNADNLSKSGVLGSLGRTPVENSIKITDIIVDNLTSDNLDLSKTITSLTSIISPQVTPKIVTDTIQKLYNVTFSQSENNTTITQGNNIETLKEPAFRFDIFSDKIRIMDSEANKKLGEYETLITEDLANKLQDDRLGIGFSPTVRNITAIIMASTEAFIRLMDETHTNAWNKRNDPIRRRVILDNTSSAKSSDAKEDIKVGPYAFLANAVSRLSESKTPVYPWPQFFVETPDDKKGRFQLQYIASPSVISLTQGNRYDVWPEVEFVEEYLKGLTQKFDPPLTQPPSNNNNITNLVNINAIEFPQRNLAYVNKDEIKYFYEIYERQFVTSHYTGLFRPNQNNLTQLIEAIQNYESDNIKTSLSSGAPSLKFKLKNYVFNSTNYVERLREFSNQGTGRNYNDFIRDFFVTPYLRTLTQNSFSILETWQEGPIPQTSSSEVIKQVKQFIDTTSNEFTVLDTYPFTNQTWTTNNMVNISKNQNNLLFNTNNTLTIYTPRNVIASFNSLTNYTYARPVTNFNYETAFSSSVNIPRVTPSQLLPTEGFAGNTVTSMMNTPYFINAIQLGVKNYKEKKKYPYKEAAYLFLNSLPLITLREQLKTKLDGNLYSDNDYMFAVLKKFGAIHKLPYAWILKMGSIWHRYKTYKETNVDILDSVWTNFNYIENYDPVTKNPQKKYKFVNSGQEQEIQMSSKNNDTYNTEVGFYPKLINDFNIFYNGFEIFKDYTDSSLQKAVDKNLKIVNLSNSNLVNISGGNFKLNLKTWSVMFPVEDIVVDIKDCAPQSENRVTNMLIFPSFGWNQQNQSSVLVQGDGIINPNTSFNGNYSVFNGSCRLYWAAPNYGYFDTTKVKKPNTDEYLNSIEENPKNIAPFRLLPIDEEYTKIEEIFSVFDKKILDSFETEFLNFCKPTNDISITAKTTIRYNGVNTRESDDYRNFQTLMRNMMKVLPKKAGQEDYDYFVESITEQQKILQNQISAFLKYDVIFRYGNPSEYNERIFNSFLSHNNTWEVIDPIKFLPYEKNTLPSSNGNVTLEQSKQNYKKTWEQLELEVGFSTIQELKYTNQGSYITDFFIDNNIKFSIENITLLAPIIKIYATQKLKTPNITATQFRNLLLQFNDTATKLQDEILDGVMEKVRNGLPDQQIIAETKFNSVVDGDVSKVETYEKLKALNDKWIAGGDFTNKTYFEDILFLDRASRNIGETLLVDIFKLKNMMRKSATESNLQMSVYTFLAGFLIENNFVIMNLPSYTNFYNVQNVDGVNLRSNTNNPDFANNFWGTFLNVDYTNSSPKMVCFYTGKPSQYLDLPDNKYYRFRNDSYDFQRKSEVSAIEDTSNKTDEAISNKCVGFTVDIGIRNQNIFRSFTVGQENGKATAEAVNQVYEMSSQASGVNVATQNTGLYNLYKQRSYTCEVSMMGNAMIQPTMYFNLRHVPMFNGSYLIQEVNHRIESGVFETKLKATRQGIFDLPQIDKYLQSINRNLLTKLEQIVRTSKDNVSSIPITANQKANNTQSGSSNKDATPNSCVNSVLPGYLNDGFTSVETKQTIISPQEMLNEIDLVMKQFGSNETLRKLIYSVCYVTNYNNGQFVGYSNNYSTLINLEISFNKDGYQGKFNKTYSCIQGTDAKKSSIPIANFDKLYDFVSFIYSRLKNNIKIAEKIGFWEYYCRNYPEVNRVKPDEFQKEKENNQYQKVYERLREGLSNMRTLGVDVNESNINELLTGKTKNAVSTTSTANQPLCPEPIITSWEPKRANINSLSPEITIKGTSLWGQTQVTLNGTNCTIKVNTENLIIVVPKKKVNGKLLVKTKYGQVETTEEFIFDNPT
jgi:hypothetical protein